MPVSTEQILKAILDHSPENIVLMDRDHKVICYNERIRETLFQFHGRHIEVGDDYRDFVVAMAMDTYLIAFAKALNGQITEIDLDTIGENYRHWYHYRVNPVYSLNSELLGVSLSAENITDRKLTQQKLEESEGKFRALVEQSLIGIFILLEEEFIYVNPAFESIIGVKAKHIIQAYKFTDLIHEDDIHRVVENCRDIEIGAKDQCHLIVGIKRIDGTVRSLEIKMSLIRYNGSKALLGSALDITERLDEEIRISEAVDRGQELERTNIGMELHDNVAQQLAAIILNLQFYRDGLARDNEEDDLLKTSIGYLQQTLSDVRQLSHRIAPAIADQTGIFDKVRDLIKRMNVKGQLKVVLDLPDGDDHLNSAIQLVIYRIVQEQFSNIIKYAKASSVQITVQKDTEHLIVKIIDDGVGSNLKEKTSGIGLHNIRRRIQVYGGNVQIQSSVGKGFSLTAYIPLKGVLRN